MQNAFSEHKWRVLGVVIFGVFMIILDTTVVNVAFETLQAEFGGNLNYSQWILSIYVMALGISTPLAGFLGDRFGSKKVYLGGLGLFVVGSLLCGLSPSLPALIAARAIQGVGGGLAMPLGTALLLQAFPANEQGMALGVFGIAALVAPAVGPILGGWLVDIGMWRMIFFINPPIGLAGILLGTRWLKESQSERRAQIDVLGIITEVLGFGAILYGASVAADQGWGAPGTMIWFVVGAAGLIAFCFIELYVARHPLLDLRLFASRVFTNASLLGYISTVALFGAEFLMPVYLQTLRGMSALQTGFVLLPMAITGGVFVLLAGRIYDKVGPRLLMVTGFTILMINTWQLSEIRGDTSIAWILFLLALRGIALGLTVQTTFVTALSVVRRRDYARGSSLVNATRLVVQSIGVAVLATVLASAISPEIQSVMASQEAQAVQGQNSQIGNAGADPSVSRSAAPMAICTASSQAPLAEVGFAMSGAGLPDGPLNQGFDPGLLKQACAENIAGFDRAYTVTFFAALLAVLFSIALPGWPGKWEGRKDAPEAVMGH